MKSYAGPSGLINSVLVPIAETLPNPNGRIAGDLFYVTHGGPTVEGLYVHDGLFWNQCILTRGGTITGEMSIAKLTVTHMLQGNLSGNATSANKLALSRELNIYGDASAQLEFDGSNDAKGELTLTATGVTPDTYSQVTVDAKGRVLKGTKGTIWPITTASYRYDIKPTDHVVLCNQPSSMALPDAKEVAAGKVYLIKSKVAGSQINSIIDGTQNLLLEEKKTYTIINDPLSGWVTL